MNSERQKERRRTDPAYRERLAASQRARPRSKGQREWDAKDAEERKVKGTPAWARQRLRSAVYKGRVTKPDTCERCKQKFPRHALHGHHYHGDYANRPFDVEWLCSMCHSADHHFGDAMSLYRQREVQPEPLEAT